jgi:hypothetical protein
MSNPLTDAAQSAPWRLPALIVATAACILVIGLRLTNPPSEAESSLLGEERDKTKDIRKAVAGIADLDAGSKMIVETFATQSAEPATNGAQSALIPEEWEQPLFDILLNEDLTMDQRNAGLIDLATGPAKGVPSVQEECLMHLLFGISSNSGAQFVAVATNPAIPVGMRADFLKEALAMRPAELGEWLSQQVSNHHEPEISTIARLYLLDSRSEAE